MLPAELPPRPPLPAVHPAAGPVVGRVADGLELHTDGLGPALRLHVEGELDAFSAPRLVDAMAWLRRRHDGGIVLDLHDVSFVDMAGYRAIRRVCCDGDGHPDPRIARVIGPAVAKLELVVALATGR
jgi:anti-anti-sigma factor